MKLLSVLLFAVCSSSDNLIVGLSYGAKNVKISFISNLIISLISGLGTFIAMLCGSMLLGFISIKYSNMIGSGILILFGVYMLLNWYRKDQAPSEVQRYENTLRKPEIIDLNGSKTIDIKEAAVLGFILCINNAGLGIGASITGLNIYMTSAISMVFSLLFIPAGFHLGKKLLSDRLSGYSEIISICIIIFLGIYELFI
jgi:putative sporulation protein YtaF